MEPTLATDPRLSEDETREWMITVAHEMRASLQALVLGAGMADHLLESDPASARRCMKGVLSSAMLVGRLVTDLVDSARVHELPCVPIDIDVVCLLRELAMVFEGLETHQVQLALPDGLLIHADAGRVRQIVRNLLSNAAKYSTPGPLVLCAALRERSVVISLRDQGPGISSAELRRLFGRYQRLSEGGDGLGVGLWLSRRLALAMGGDMWATSELGGATSFYLALPASSLPPASVS